MDSMVALDFFRFAARHASPKIFGLAILLLACGAFGLAAPSVAQAFEVRPQDSIWIVSTRCLNRCPGVGEADALSTMRYAGGSWQTLSFADLAAENSSERTDVLFVHGNGVEPNEVGGLICRIYGALTSCDGPAVRLIFWSWPSDKVAGPLHDVLAKDERSFVEIAWLREALSELPHVGPRSLVGYSFGARIVAGATATYDPLRTAALPDADAAPVAISRPPQRAILIAGALDRTKLYPGGAYSGIYARLDHVSIWFNTADPALKRYHLVDKGADALGYVGLPNWSAIGSCRIDQTNVTNWIGRTHWLSAYLDDPSARNLLRRQALWEDAPAVGVASTLTPSAAASSVVGVSR
ncbi:MAG TPA: hypothetical protein VGN57_08945 [Pirellulaceae bacterium]|jgi:hypothetical protein|nr:hypothetical protein [Pirellulaceae bacterium]